MAGRTDNVTDPVLAAQLLITRRGQAYFSRKLNQLSDAEFDGPSLLSGWTRRELIAHVGLNARALTHLTEWASTGVEHAMYDSPSQRNDDIAFFSTVPAQALRNLSDHAAIHLNVEWRDLPEAAWSSVVRTVQGREVPVSETVWMRAREVWVHAVDLGNGGSFTDFPPAFIDALLADITGSWNRRRDAEGLPIIRLRADDRGIGARADGGTDEPAESGVITVQGAAARLAQWASGRGAVDLTVPGGGPVPDPPRWL